MLAIGLLVLKLSEWNARSSPGVGRRNECGVPYHCNRKLENDLFQIPDKLIISEISNKAPPSSPFSAVAVETLSLKNVEGPKDGV
jgi:hypothetical protein